MVVMDGATGFVRSLYRPYEQHHSLFVTERCSSNCLMCSQPPKDKDDVETLATRNRELIKLIDPALPYLTITGGEPTLLGNHLFRLIDQLKTSLPNTELHILTNGRTFAWPGYAQRLAALNHPNLCLGVPLYSDFAGEHDYVVQAKGAFDQTVAGLHQAARNGIRVEIRIVLHRLTIPRLVRLAEFIYRNLSFVEHVALMGLEYVGYTPRNIDELWIDPFDYQSELEETVRYLSVRNIPVSIYNHQSFAFSGHPFGNMPGSQFPIGKTFICPNVSLCGVLAKSAVASSSGLLRNIASIFTRCLTKLRYVRRTANLSLGNGPPRLCLSAAFWAVGSWKLPPPAGIRHTICTQGRGRSDFIRGPERSVIDPGNSVASCAQTTSRLNRSPYKAMPKPSNSTSGVVRLETPPRSGRSVQFADVDGRCLCNARCQTFSEALGIVGVNAGVI